MRLNSLHARWCISFNGAALVRARKSWFDARAKASVNTLQWGRARASAEMAFARSLKNEYQRLQWGRARASAEMHFCGISPALDSYASMGPSSCERGNTPSWQMGHTLGPRFNGAALVRARKWHERQGWLQPYPGPLQWGRARASAEMRSDGLREIRPMLWLQWGRARASAEISRYHSLHPVRCSFNGAALVRARKCILASPFFSPSLASMGPRSCERGNENSSE